MKTINQAKREMLPATPCDLAGLVEYAPGSVVSRTVADAKAGTVTVFAFAEDQGLSEHSAPFDALVNVIEGEGEFTVGGETHRVTAGQILRMPAEVPHSVRAAKPFKMMLIMIREKA